MDIADLFRPQARARRNARGALRTMQVRRDDTHEADAAVAAAASGPARSALPGEQRAPT